MNRIPSKEGIREVSLYFAVELGKIDTQGFKVSSASSKFGSGLTLLQANLSEIIGTWFSTILFERCTFQNTLTSLLLQTLSERDALFGGLLRGTGLDEDVLEVTTQDLTAKRLIILKSASVSFKGFGRV